MEWILCNKEYVGERKTSFNVRLNDYRKDLKNVDAIMIFKDFQQECLNFKKHAKFTIMDQLTSTSKSKETLTQQLIEKENFWILNLDTLHPQDFNVKLSK